MNSVFIESRSRTFSLFFCRVEIEQFGHLKKHTFCAGDAAFPTGVQKRVEWKPSCRENAPDPGTSIFGAILNTDPVGNAQYVIDQVNPLKANPLNGLAAIENTFSGLMSAVDGMKTIAAKYGQASKLQQRKWSSSLSKLVLGS